MSLTTARKSEFCRCLLTNLHTPIGFADVGSGGPLKSPWNLLPADRLTKFDFDPEALGGQSDLPLCISNQTGTQLFYVAVDARSSSLHPAAPRFVERFGRSEMLPKETIRVNCLTLDQFFAGRYGAVDVLDVNVEGHDFQALQGAAQLLSTGFVKALKVEFELIEVWQGQGWLGDIDGLMRQHGYDLAHIDLEFSRPVNARSIFHRGEPLWGKAIYVPGPERWSARSDADKPVGFEDDLLKAIVLYTLLDMPGRALDLLAGFDQRLARTNVASQIVAVFKYSRVDAVYQRLASWARLVLKR